jgi:hypothetical protein
MLVIPSDTILLLIPLALPHLQHCCCQLLHISWAAGGGEGHKAATPHLLRLHGKVNK